MQASWLIVAIIHTFVAQGGVCLGERELRPEATFDRAAALSDEHFDTGNRKVDAHSTQNSVCLLHSNGTLRRWSVLTRGYTTYRKRSSLWGKTVIASVQTHTGLIAMRSRHLMSSKHRVQLYARTIFLLPLSPQNVVWGFIHAICRYFLSCRFLLSLCDCVMVAALRVPRKSKEI